MIPLLLLLITGFLQAQDFTHETKIPKIDRSGFFRIALTPDIIKNLNSSLGNIRIHNQENKEVPFLVQEERPVLSTVRFVNYSIFSKKLTPGCCTEIILDNSAQKPINNISLQIKNAEVTKQATLLGSDDRSKWFALKQHFTFFPVDNKDQTSEVRILDFPLSNYRFLKLNIDDSTSAPINIIKAGYYDSENVSGNYTPVPNVKLSVNEREKEKKTIIWIHLEGDQLVDKINFKVEGPAHYFRRATLFIPASRNVKKGKTEQYNRYLQSMELTSTHEAVINTDHVKTKALLMEVDNDDNPPLRFQQVTVYQLDRYIVAWLEADKIYTLKTGDSNIPSPEYDIEHFRKIIPDRSPILTPGKLLPLNEEKPVVEVKGLFGSKQIIWLAIIVVVSLLAFLSIRMVKEIGGK